jgi:hypothetical protein
VESRLLKHLRDKASHVMFSIDTSGNLTDFDKTDLEHEFDNFLKTEGK